MIPLSIFCWRCKERGGEPCSVFLIEGKRRGREFLNLGGRKKRREGRCSVAVFDAGEQKTREKKEEGGGRKNFIILRREGMEGGNPFSKKCGGEARIELPGGEKERGGGTACLARTERRRVPCYFLGGRVETSKSKWDRGGGEGEESLLFLTRSPMAPNSKDGGGEEGGPDYYSLI